MAGLTQAQVQVQLDNAVAALSSAMAAKQVSLSSPTGGRTLQHQDVQQLQSVVEYWERRMARFGRNGPTFYAAVPLG